MKNNQKKNLIIGDVHGTKLWQKHLEKFREYETITFLGDYFDDWNNDWSKVDQIANLQNILDMQGLYDNKIKVLLGNHDLAYLIPEIVSGHQSNKAIDIKEFLEKNLSKFDIACKVGDWICSHAGFSGYWMKKYGFANIEEVNDTFHNKNYQPFKFYSRDYSCSGDNELQGPTWLRPTSLKFSSCFDKQIVGHTATDDLQTNHLRFKGLLGNKQEIYIVDKHDHSAYLEI